MSNHVTVHLEATSGVVFHCEHPEEGDAVSLRITGDHHQVSVYLGGTPEEIRDLGERLISEANHQRAKILTRQGVGAVA